MAAAGKKKRRSFKETLENLGHVTAVMEGLLMISGLAGILGVGADSPVGPIFQEVARFIYRWRFLIGGILLISLAVDLGVIIRQLRRPSKERTPFFRLSIVYLGMGLLLFLTVFYLIRPTPINLAISVSAQPLEKKVATVKDSVFSSQTVSPHVLASFGNSLVQKIIQKESVVYPLVANRQNPHETLAMMARRLEVDIVVSAQMEIKGKQGIVVILQMWDSEKNSLVIFPNGQNTLQLSASSLDEMAVMLVEAILDQLQLNAVRFREEDSEDSVTPYELYFEGLNYYQWLSQEGLNRAIERFKQAIELEPDYPLPYAGLSQAYWLQGVWAQWQGKDHERYEKNQLAFEMAKKAVALGPEYPESHLAMAFRHWFQGNTTKARHELQIVDSLLAQVLHPMPLVASEWYILQAFLSDSIAQKERYHLKAIETYPSAVLAYSELANIYTNRGKFDAAIVLLKRAIEKIPGSGYLYYLLADAYRRKKDFQQALTVVDKVLEILPTFYEAHYLRGFIYAEMGLMSRAIRECRYALQHYPGQINGIFSSTFVDRDFKAFEVDSIYYRGLIRRNSSFAYAYLQYANLITVKGKHFLEVKNNVERSAAYFEEAKKYLIRAIQLDPWLAPAYLSLAWIRYFTEQELPLADVQQAIHYAPRWADAYLFQGWLYFRLMQQDTLPYEKRYRASERAQDALEQVLDLNPGIYFATRTLGHVFFLKNNMKQAKKYYQMVLEYWEEDDETRQSLQTLNYLAQYRQGKVSWQSLFWLNWRDSLDPVGLLIPLLNLTPNIQQLTENERLLLALLLFERQKDISREIQRLQELHAAMEKPQNKRLIQQMVLLATAREYVNREQLDSTVVLIQQALALDSLNAPFWFIGGKILLDQDFDSLATIVFRQVVRMDSTQPEGWRYLAHSWFYTRDYAHTIQAFQDYLQRFTGKAADWNLYGVALYKQEQYQEAARAFHKAVKLDSTNDTYWENLANCYLKLNQSNLALAFFQRATQLPTSDSYPYYQIAKIYRNQKQLKKAYRAIVKAIEREPDKERNWVRALTILREFSSLKEAYRKAQQLLNRFPQQFLAFYLVGYFAYQMDDIDSAIRYLKQAVRRQPDDVDSWRMLARCYQKQENIPASIEAITHVIRLQPEDPENWFARALIYYQELQFKRAWDDIQQALRLDGNNFEYLKLAGYIQYNLENYAQAIKLLLRALKINNNNPEVYYVVALSYVRLEQFFAAMIYCKKGLRIAPDDERLNRLMDTMLNAK